MAEHNPDNLPPIRRRPIPLHLVNQTLEELQAAATSIGLSEGDARSSAAIDAELIDAPTEASPSAPMMSPPAPPISPPTRSPAKPYYAASSRPAYRTNAGATGGAIASVVLGVMALAAIPLIPPGSLLVSILGVPMGVWGLNSDRRGLAVVGLTLCCLAMAIAGFLSAVQLFEYFNGYNPFEGDLPPLPPETGQ